MYEGQCCVALVVVVAGVAKARSYEFPTLVPSAQEVGGAPVLAQHVLGGLYCTSSRGSPVWSHQSSDQRHGLAVRVWSGRGVVGSCVAEEVKHSRHRMTSRRASRQGRPNCLSLRRRCDRPCPQPRRITAVPCQLKLASASPHLEQILERFSLQTSQPARASLSTMLASHIVQQIAEPSCEHLHEIHSWHATNPLKGGG